MQLGELQNQIARFERRNVSVIALSVDTPSDSAALIGRLGLTYALGSDPDQRIVKAFGVQNPDTRELALHAVYLVDRQGKVFYRKVARRRPTSDELIDAVDAYRGVYPQSDPAAPRAAIPVAYPQNDFQALLEISQASRLPVSVDAHQVSRVLALMRARQIDDATQAFKHFCLSSTSVSTNDLLSTAAWLIRQLMFAEQQDALAAGERLAAALQQVNVHTRARDEAETDDARDQALHALAGARARLEAARAAIERQAGPWQLRFAKTHLRSYREVVHAARRAHGNARG